MASGTVKDFNPDKGWGFASSDDGTGDVMLHVRGLCPGEDPAWLVRGTRVSYDVARTQRGLRATNIRTHLETRPRVGSGVMSADQFRDEVSTYLAAAVDQIVGIAIRNGWVD